MKLYGMPASHFTRKVRVVLHELGLPFEFIHTEQLTKVGPEHFGGNPLHQIPVLEDGAMHLIDSDVICEYLIGTAPSAPFPFLPAKGDRFLHLQCLAILNGGMNAGAHIMQARRSEIPDFARFPLFQQKQASVEAALAWAEQELGRRTSFASSFSILDISLQCFADWVLFRELLPSLEAFPNITAFRAHHAARPSFALTHPEARLT